MSQINVDTIKKADGTGSLTVPAESGTVVVKDGSNDVTLNNITATGVYLGGTGAANYLDDYEEGTWTPSFSSGTGSITAAANHTYTKIGRLVTINGYIYNNSGYTSGEDVKIQGLPFAVGTQKGEWYGSVDFYAANFDPATSISIAAHSTWNYVKVSETVDNGATDWLTYGELGTGHVRFSLTYVTDA